ncbi:hypothetical protein [uncultured Akkermansia sp.]|uniref:hypothetical protein n=1 Tax=uncultured Akkermansia sp. TaxID=512294 RepID=UPI00260FCD42|nr:hypothetical protein [uncultured Akkermansia sp.]
MHFFPFKRIKKCFCAVIAAFAVIYAINAIYASWCVFRTLNGSNDDEMRYYELTMYPSNGYEGIYVYAKTSLIYSFIPQDLVFVKKEDGETSIWYGGRLFKKGKEIYMPLEMSNSERYRKVYEEKYWMTSEELEKKIIDLGFIKIK